MHSQTTVKLISFCTLIAVLLLLTVVAFPSNEAQRATLSEAYVRSDNKPEPTQILIKFKPSVGEAKKAEILKEHQLRVRSKIEQIKVDILSVDPSDTPQEAVDRVKAKHKEEIEFAEVDEVIEPSFTPNDSLFSRQWHHPQITSPRAWDTTTGNSVIIAILDTGVESAHPDLASKIVPGWNFYSNTSDTSDTNGHGTAVAGTAAAIGNNGIGVAGVAPNSLIMPIRISDPNGYASWSTVAQGLTWAADRGARVANNSYRSSTSSTVKTAAQYFQNKGGVVTVSAGNESDFETAADNPYVLTVSASDEKDQIAFWSTTGNIIDLAAPGVNLYTTSIGGRYGSFSGTSASAPVVAGVAALVISVNPSLTGAEVQDILKQSADDLGSAGWDSQYGWGRVNSGQAVNFALGNTTKDTIAPLAPLNFKATAIYNTLVNLTWSASTDNIGVVDYMIYRDNALLDIISSSNLSYADTFIIPAATSTPEYGIEAFDAAHNLSPAATATVNFSLAPADTIPPSAPTNCTTQVLTNTSVKISWWPSSDNVQVVGYNIYRNDLQIGSILNGPYTDNTAAAGSTYTYYVRAYDTSNNLSAASNSSTITTSGTPTDTAAPSAPTNLVAQITTGMTVSLTWSASSDNVGVTGYRILRNASPTDSSAFVLGTTTPTSYVDMTITIPGNYSYTVQAYDAANNYSGNSNTANINVAAPADTTPPSAPTNLTASAPDNTKAVLAWSASTDNVGVTGHNVLRNGTKIAIASGTTYTDSTVTAGTTYSYNVQAYDAAGNVSGNSNTATVTVPAVPTLAVINVNVSNKTGTSAKINWQTTLTATGYVKYGTSSNNLSFTSPVTATGTTHSVTLTGLTKRTIYYYQVVGQTSAGETALSSVSSFRTLNK